MRVAVIDVKDIDNGVIVTMQAGPYIVEGLLTEFYDETYRVMIGGRNNSVYFNNLTNLYNIHYKLGNDYHDYRDGVTKPLPWDYGEYPEEAIEQAFRDIDEKKG